MSVLVEDQKEVAYYLPKCFDNCTDLQMTRRSSSQNSRTAVAAAAAAAMACVRNAGWYVLVWHVDFEPALELLALCFHRGPAAICTRAYRDDLFVACFVERKSARRALISASSPNKFGGEEDC